MHIHPQNTASLSTSKRAETHAGNDATIALGRRTLWYPWALVIGTLCTVLLACGSDTSGPTNPAQVYWSLRLNYHAANMATVAPYDTLQLHVTAYSPEGNVLPDSGVTTTYQTKDSSVSVSPTGLVTAHFRTRNTTNATWVAAFRQYQNVTLADTIFIQITDTVPQHPVATFSLQPTPGDSAKRALGTASYNLTWGAQVTDSAGNTVCNNTKCNLLIYYTSSNPSVAAALRSTKNGLLGGHLTLYHVGRVMLQASAWIYGTAWSDSVMFTVGYQTATNIAVGFTTSGKAIYCSFSYLCAGNSSFGTVVIARGGVVSFWCLDYTDPDTNISVGCITPVDIVFDHPEFVDSASTPDAGAPPTGNGNIAAFQADISAFGDGARSRRFTQAGVYHFYSTVVPSDTVTLQVLDDPSHD